MAVKIICDSNLHDVETLYNCQQDLIQVLQASLNSDIRHGAGYYTLFLIEMLAAKQYEVTSEAISVKNQPSL